MVQGTYLVEDVTVSGEVRVMVHFSGKGGSRSRLNMEGPYYLATISWLCLLVLAIYLEGKILILGVKPEFLTALVFIFGMRKRDDLKAACFGAVVGFIEDILSGFWGANMISKTLIGYLSANILGGFFVWSPILGIIGIFFMTLLDSLFVLLVMGLKDQPVHLSGWVIYTIIGQSLINAPLGYFAGPVSSPLKRRTALREEA